MLQSMGSQESETTEKLDNKIPNAVHILTYSLFKKSSSDYHYLYFAEIK